MATGESIPDPIRLTLGGPSAVHDAVAAANSFAERAVIGGDNRSRLAIVVEELVTNLYDHGCLTAHDKFELELAFNGREVDLVLTAPGAEFDPTTADEQRTLSSNGAGAGLKLVKAWSNRFEYEYLDGRNRTALTLPIER